MKKKSLTIEWMSAGGERNVRRLALNPDTSLKSRANRKLLRGEMLYNYLLGCGAVLQDGRDAAGGIIPSVQIFYALKDAKKEMQYRTDGILQNPSPDEPAMQIFTPRGVLAHVTHHHNGKLQDPPSGEPAEQWMDEEGLVVMAMRAPRGGGLHSVPIEEIPALAARVEAARQSRRRAEISAALKKGAPMNLLRGIKPLD